MFESLNQDGMSFSIRNGLYMPFMYKGRQVVVHNSSWSFRETIWVDDEVAVTRISISMTSTHTIEVAGDQLTIYFGYRNRMRNIFVQATVGDATVHSLDHQVRAVVSPWRLGVMVAAGAVVGYGFGHLVGTLLGGA